MARIPVPFYSERQVAPSGPFLDANARGGQLADIAGPVNQGLARVANTAAFYAEQRENDQAIAWSNDAASKFKLQQFQKFQDAKDNAPNGGDGLTSNYLQSYDDDAGNLINSAPTPRAKKYLTSHLDTFRTQMGEQSIREEYALSKEYLVSSTQSAVNSSAQLIGSPGGDRSQFQNELNTHLDTIKNLRLPPNVKDKLSEETKKALTGAYWDSYIRDDPQGAAQMLRGQQPLSSDGNSPQELIRKEASAQGVDPHQALAIAKLENDTFDPSRPNAMGSSAQGLFQVTKDTWAELGGTDANRLDPAAQAQIGIKNVARNTKGFKAMVGRDPTPGELYSTQWGLGFAGALAKAPDSEPVRDLFSKVKINPDVAMQQNRLPDSMTAGQLRSAFNAQMGKALASTSAMAQSPAAGQPPPPVADANVKTAIENTPVPQQLAYLTHAESMARRDDTQAKVELEGRHNDTMAAYSQFKDAPNPPTMQEYVTNFGAVRGAQMFAQQQDAQRYAHIGAGLATMSADQMQSTVKAAEPAPGPDFAEKQRMWSTVATAADNINKMRQADMIGYAMGPGGGITKKIDWTQPEAFSGPLAARFIQGSQLSKQYQVPFAAFDKEDVNELGQMLDKAPWQQSMSMLRQIRAASDSPEHYQAAIAQLAPNHPVLAVAGGLPAIGYAGIQDPAQYVIKGDRLLHPDKTDKAETGGAKVLMPPESTGGFRDLWDKSVGGAFPGEKSSDQYFNAAVAYYIGKQDPAKRSDKVANIDPNLWREAVNVVAPSVDWSNGKVLVPHGVYAPQFRDSMAKVWPRVMQAYGLDPAEHNMDSYPLKMAPDGMYAVTNGTTALWGANGYPVVFGLDGRLPDMAPAPQFEPTPAKLGKVRDPLSLPMKRSTR